MLRLILTTLFLGIWLPCFSEEFRNNLKEWQGESLKHMSDGSINLLSNEPWRALRDFQRAEALLDRSDRASSAIGFLISFGQVIAYDALGFREQCKQSIGSLFLTFNEYNKEEDRNAEDGTNKNFLVPDEYEESVEFLRNLAAVAPSSDVRELLFSFVDQIAEELLPAFKFSGALFFGEAAWDFDYGKNDVSIMQCKSWWKKFKKWCREVGELLGILNKGYKDAKGIKNTYDEWKKNQNYTNPNYINPNFRVN
jgi:hypothetical protein